MKYFIYPSGLPFSEKLAENLNDEWARIQLKKASMIIVDGGVGEGKTTLAIHCSDYLMTINESAGVWSGRDWREVEFKDQLAMGGADFAIKLRVCYEKKLIVIVYDEAGDFNRRAALTRFNAMLNRTFETYRAFKIIVILVLPSFAVLDQDIFLKNIPRLLLRCQGRTEKAGSFRGWSLAGMQYIRDKMKKSVVKSRAYDQVQFNFAGHFCDLPRERSAALDAISISGKLKNLQKAEIALEGLIDYNELAKRLQRSVSWCRDAIGQLSIKPQKVVNKRRYFNQDIVTLLADYSDELVEKLKGNKGGKKALVDPTEYRQRARELMEEHNPGPDGEGDAGE